MWPIQPFLLYLLIGLISVEALRTKDKMYSSVSGASCFRRLNATHTTGCSSTFGGSTGVLHLIKSETDFDFILNDPPSPPYALVIPPRLFTRPNIMRIKDDHRVSAIVLINSTEGLNYFSTELNCPNQYFQVAGQQCDASRPETTWNPFGSGLLHENFPFPIYFISEPDEIQKIVDCFEKFNNFNLDEQDRRPLCSIQINAFMSAAVNSEVCLRRTSFTNSLSVTRFCDPLAGQNAYATVFPRDSTNPSKRKIQSNEMFILVTTRIDTTSMFDGMGPGAMGSLVSYATLISTAHMLAELLPKPNTKGHDNILFMFFNGEAYDYIGSQRFVYDVNRGEFPPSSQHTNPISLENIRLMIDIGTLDDVNSIKLYHAREFSQVKKLETLLNKYNSTFGFNMNFTDNLSNNLPPTSAQSLLRENISFPAIILQSNSTNRYYHSVYDGAENINYTYHNTSQDFTKLSSVNSILPFQSDTIQMKIRNISSVLSSSLYELITGQEYDKDGRANPVLIDELLYCFLISSNCPLLKAASQPNSQPNLPIPLLRYISVSGSFTHQSVGWTYRILGLLVGQKVEVQKEHCNQAIYFWYAGYDGIGQCHRLTQNLSSAMSPAFLIDDYNWTSGHFSTWTESTWKELNARIYLKPSSSHEAFNLAIGFVVMLISFVLVFLINSRSDVLFGNALTTESEVSPAPAQC